MITLTVHNLHDNSSKSYMIDRMYDFDRLSVEYGNIINEIVGEFKSVRAASEAVAEYLSSHHMEAEISDTDDLDDIYDPNVESETEGKESPKNAVDLKGLLEDYDKTEHVNIDDYHVLNAATHRWED